jgi:hypothetical protein
MESLERFGQYKFVNMMDVPLSLLQYSNIQEGWVGAVLWSVSIAKKDFDWDEVQT